MVLPTHYLYTVANPTLYMYAKFAYMSYVTLDHTLYLINYSTTTHIHSANQTTNWIKVTGYCSTHTQGTSNNH